VSEQYRVRVEKDQFVFSAAHFITFDGNVCERLHGHNYRPAVEVYGELDENQYVIDFILLRDAMRAIVAELDHHMLLPTEHPTIHVDEEEHEVVATFENRRWVFPRSDCILLPIPNTTTELLARYIGRRLLADLEEHTGARPTHLRVELDDCFGQYAICDLQDE